MATGYVYDPIYLEHDLRGHPENQHRLQTILGVLKRYHMLERLMPISAVPITLARLEQCHTRQYIEHVQRVAQRGGGNLDMDTYVRAASYDAALMAAGGLIEATQAVKHTLKSYTASNYTLHKIIDAFSFHGKLRFKPSDGVISGWQGASFGFKAAED